MAPILIVLLVVVLVWFSPQIIDALANRSRRHAPRSLSEKAAELHKRLWIADLHADALLWNRDLNRRHRRGHVDVPRLTSGNVSFQVFTVVSKVPFGVNFEKNSDKSDMVTALVMLQRWPVRTWFNLKERALYQAKKLHRFADASRGSLAIIKSVADLDGVTTQGDQPRVAGLLGIEGTQVLQGKLANVDVMFHAGFRLIGLTHFFDTDVAGSAHGVHKGGLTPFGLEVLRRMEELGMIVDLAHASPATIDDVLAAATKPVIVSHTGVQGTHKSTRNLADRHMQAVANEGGLIGITFFKHAIGGTDTPAIIDAIKYTADKVGVAHVGLGSDFDGAVATPFDSAGMAEITDGLLKANFSDDDVAAIMGENVRALLPKVLPS